MFEPTAGRLQLDINSLLVNIYIQTGMLGTREYTFCSPFMTNAHNSSLYLKITRFFHLFFTFLIFDFPGNFGTLNGNYIQGNSVARDLPRTGSETNTTIFVIRETTSHLTSSCK